MNILMLEDDPAIAQGLRYSLESEGYTVTHCATVTQALEAVAAYTQTFNKMRFIETEERDEIYMALRGILDALPGDTLQKDALIEQFEQLRDF